MLSAVHLVVYLARSRNQAPLPGMLQMLQLAPVLVMRSEVLLVQH